MIPIIVILTFCAIYIYRVYRDDCVISAKQYYIDEVIRLLTCDGNDFIISPAFFYEQDKLDYYQGKDYVSFRYGQFFIRVEFNGTRPSIPVYEVVQFLRRGVEITMSDKKESLL